jgi:hypothetical protein
MQIKRISNYFEAVGTTADMYGKTSLVELDGTDILSSINKLEGV